MKSLFSFGPLDHIKGLITTILFPTSTRFILENFSSSTDSQCKIHFYFDWRKKLICIDVVAKLVSFLASLQPTNFSADPFCQLKGLPDAEGASTYGRCFCMCHDKVD
jgi:hypothetical protein